MILIVGLGNPGKKYENTRHNLGFMVVDKLAENQKSKIVPPAKPLATHGKNQKYILIKPQTFMNDSGVEVKKMANFYKVDAENIWVIHDDLDQELGKIKIKKGGGSGGHNGVQSIIDNLGTDDFWHFKIGIGRPEQKSQVIDYVLQNFTKDENKIIDNSIKIIVSALTTALVDDLDKAMNKYNS